MRRKSRRRKRKTGGRRYGTGQESESVKHETGEGGRRQEALSRRHEGVIGI